ncbi:glycosyltransferase family 4 protein [Candidatus Methylocalor cossyra]|uniref:Glycosyltransferase family 1 protein n=1 Tax=Candidatus Methylocalor cossyra TaxID=3108543 RepID=A0ABP1C5M9_9GAMM
MASPQPPKRILYVENGIGYGGAVICLRHLARNLDRRKFVGRIVTGRTGPEYMAIGTDSEWRWIPDRHIDVVELRRRLERWRWLHKIPGLPAVAGQIIARLDDLANFLPFLFGLWREIRAFKPDIIHANNEPLCNRAAILLGRAMGIPTISHVRGPQSGSRLMSPLYRLPDYFIPVSRWIDREIASIGVPPSKRTVVYDGIELDKLDRNADGREFRARFDIPEQAFTVGLVGLLIPWKGQRLFLEAALRLRQAIPHLKMLIVGGTPEDCQGYAAELRDMVRSRGLADIVVFTGHVTDMSAVYNALDVVVSASLKPEPLGTMVIETMAMGRPLVAPAHGGGAEMNVHGETALLFKPGDVDDLTRCILEFYHSPELRRKLGSAATEKAFKTFDIATHVAKTEAIYRQVLAAYGKPLAQE